MKRRSVLSIILFLLAGINLSLVGQTLKSYQKAAEKALARQDYHAAAGYLQKALEIEPESVFLQFAYAETARRFNSLEIAAEYYALVTRSKQKAEYPTAYYGLGMTLKQLGDYDRAEKAFTDFINLKTTRTDQNLIKQAVKEIDICRWAAKMPVTDTVTVTALGKLINTPYSEFAPYLTDGELYYSSYRFLNKDDKHDPPRYLTKILSSKNGSKGRSLRSGFNLSDKHTAHTVFSRDGSRFYFTICDYVEESTEIRCRIYYREKDKRGRWERKPTALPAVINSDKFTATQPTVLFDSLHNKEYLIFASDRPGGRGKTDLWMSEINGKDFAPPVNLTDLNTPENEATPFYHHPTEVLYFSSDGHRGLGGYDIFAAGRKDAAWQLPRHTGKPLNSSYNDLYFFLADDARIGYLSSNRLGSRYLDAQNKTCCNDIYQAEFSAREPEEPVVTDTPPTPDIPPIETKITKPPEPTRLEDFLPLALYFDNDEPDKRTRRTTTKKDYMTTYEAYTGRRAEYIREYAAPLDDDNRYEAEILMEDFFTERVDKGYRWLFLFSEILEKRLAAGERVEIFVKGYTSPRAQSDYNVNLGKRRISSVRNHFANYDNGVFLPYLNGGKLVITERSFGETAAASGVSDDLADVRNSVYAIGAAKERRVEIVEIKRD